MDARPAALTQHLWVAEFGWSVFDLQGPRTSWCLSPEVNAHELPVPEALTGAVQQPEEEDQRDLLKQESALFGLHCSMRSMESSRSKDQRIQRIFRQADDVQMAVRLNHRTGGDTFWWSSDLRSCGRLTSCPAAVTSFQMER